jgi:Putative cyclase
MPSVDLPRYAQLVTRDDAPAGSSWGLFPDGPERGMANLAGPEQVLATLGCVRRGVAFDLDHPLDAFSPPVAPPRDIPRHEIWAKHAYARDDLLRDFYLQGSSQIDGLRHRDSRHGFYDGVPRRTDHRRLPPPLGVQRWAEHPIVGRGLLLDVDRVLRDRGEPLDHATGVAMDPSVLDDAASAQGTPVQRGDIVLVHTGWARWYLDTAVPRRRRVTAEGGVATGFAQSPGCWSGSGTTARRCSPPTRSASRWCRLSRAALIGCA